MSHERTRRESEEREVDELNFRVLHQLHDLKKAKNDVEAKVEKVLQDQASEDPQKKKQVELLKAQRVEIWRTHTLLTNTFWQVRKHHQKSEELRDSFRKLKNQIGAEHPDFVFDENQEIEA